MNKIPIGLSVSCVLTAIILGAVFLTTACKKEEAPKPEAVQGETVEEQDALYEDEDGDVIADETQAQLEDEENNSEAPEENSKADSNEAQTENKKDSASSSSLTKAEAIALINKTTAEASKKSYSWRRSCNYTPTGSIDVGGEKFTSMLNSVVDSIAKGQTLDTVMGDFIGIGNASGSVKNGKLCAQMKDHSEYLLAPTHLTANDVTSYQQNGNTFVLNIKNCVNPERDHKNALNHATNDFVTPASMTDLVEGNSKGLMKIDRNSSFAKYRSIVVKATIENDKLVRYEVSYLLKSDPLVLKVKIAPVPIKGYGEVKLFESYSNFS